MSKLRILIADDERPAREFLKAVLRELENVEIVGEAETGADAVEMIRELRPDLALLDLQMPEVSGIDVVKQLRRSQTPLVAFVTAYDEYAVQAFELNAVDYLLKPVDRARLNETIQRASERLERTDWRDAEAERLASAANFVESGPRAEPLERIPVRLREEILLVPIAEIASVIADGELLNINTADNRKYVINYRLKDLELRLDGRKFIRLSRSAIANVDMISAVSPMPGGTYMITLSNGQQIASSRLQSRIIRSKLLKL